MTNRRTDGHVDLIKCSVVCVYTYIGFSRIPIYEGERKNVISLLFTKDLVFVDPDDKIPLKGLLKFYKSKCFFIYADTTLDVVFREFKECKHK